jgi:hypothetical protein
MSINDKHTYNKLIEIGYIREPRYNIWLSRGYWHPLDAALLFNGIDPHIRLAAEAYIKQKNTEVEVKGAYTFEGSTNHSNFPASKDDMENFANFLTTVSEEKEAIETWQVFPDPLVLINTYLQKLGDIPNHMLRLAKKSFLELYQKRDCDEKTKEYWNNNWRNNIATPFLKLITDEDEKSDQSLPNKKLANQNTSTDAKIILEESAEAREIRIRNRGYEIYKLLREQYPNKKITKEIIAEQILKEEEPLYRLIFTTNPRKKQPALATYIKEIRKTY